jgi:hypothetical protein
MTNSQLDLSRLGQEPRYSSQEQISRPRNKRRYDGIFGGQPEEECCVDFQRRLPLFQSSRLRHKKKRRDNNIARSQPSARTAHQICMSGMPLHPNLLLLTPKKSIQENPMGSRHGNSVNVQGTTLRLCPSLLPIVPRLRLLAATPIGNNIPKQISPNMTRTFNTVKTNPKSASVRTLKRLMTRAAVQNMTIQSHLRFSFGSQNCIIFCKATS